MYPHRRCGHKYAAEVGQISDAWHSPPTETSPPPALARAPPLDRGRARVREEIGETLTVSRSGRERYIRVRLTETELNKVRAKAELAGMTVSDFIRETAIYGKQEFTLAKLPGGERVDVKEALEGLLDTEQRTVQKHFNVTPYEDIFIRDAARKAGMTQSRFMVDRILHTPMYYIGDPDFFQKFFYELNKQGVNLNQLAAAANTLILLQDMPDMASERRRELAAQIENFVATLKDPYCKALAETRGLMMQLRRQSEVER